MLRLVSPVFDLFLAQKIELEQIPVEFIHNPRA